MKLVELTDIPQELAKELNIIYGDHLYGCYLEDTIIGYAVIKANLTERVYLVIVDEYQDKGYGSKAFKELLSLINDTVECSVSLDNVKMQRIVSKNNGKEMGRNGKSIHYVIERI